MVAGCPSVALSLPLLFVISCPLTEAHRILLTNWSGDNPADKVNSSVKIDGSQRRTIEGGYKWERINHPTDEQHESTRPLQPTRQLLLSGRRDGRWVIGSLVGDIGTQYLRGPGTLPSQSSIITIINVLIIIVTIAAFIITTSLLSK